MKWTKIAKLFDVSKSLFVFSSCFSNSKHMSDTHLSLFLVLRLYFFSKFSHDKLWLSFSFFLLVLWVIWLVSLLNVMLGHLKLFSLFACILKLLLFSFYLAQDGLFLNKKDALMSIVRTNYLLLWNHISRTNLRNVKISNKVIGQTESIIYMIWL